MSWASLAAVPVDERGRGGDGFAVAVGDGVPDGEDVSNGEGDGAGGDGADPPRCGNRHRTELSAVRCRGRVLPQGAGTGHDTAARVDAGGGDTRPGRRDVQAVAGHGAGVGAVGHPARDLHALRARADALVSVLVDPLPG